MQKWRNHHYLPLIVSKTMRIIKPYAARIAQNLPATVWDHWSMANLA